MDIRFACDKCGRHLVIDEAGAGITIDCPDCGKPVCVPQPAPRKPSAPPTRVEVKLLTPKAVSASAPQATSSPGERRIVLGIAPSAEAHERGVQLLIRKIASEVLADVRVVMQNKQTTWHHAAYFGLKLQVRNSLREAGFKWDDVWLDDHWHELVEEAAATPLFLTPTPLCVANREERK